MKKDDLHLYVFGLVYRKDRDKVIETKLRFCAKEKVYETYIKGKLHNIGVEQKSIEKHQNDSVVVTEEDKEQLL